MIEMSSTNKSDSDSKVLRSTNVLKSTNVLESDTLTNIINLSKECIKFLDLLQESRKQILLDIKNNETNFFEQNPLIISQFNALFDPTLYKSKVQMFAEELEDTLDSYCCHEYVEDLIDVEYDRSKRVVYCQLCELTKR
jgi:hypothetical protein